MPCLSIAVQHVSGRSALVRGEARLDAGLHVHDVFSPIACPDTGSSRTPLINGRWNAGVSLRRAASVVGLLSPCLSCWSSALGASSAYSTRRAETQWPGT